MTRSPVPLPIYNSEARKTGFHVVRLVALLAACFCCFVAGRMAYTVIHDWRQSPLIAADAANPASSTVTTDPLIAEYRKLRLQLAANQEDSGPADRIRQIDLTLRERYFAHHATLVRGAYLLLGGFIVLLLAVKASTQWGERASGVMTVFASPADPWRAAGVARCAIAVAGCALIAGFVALQRFPAASFGTPKIVAGPTAPLPSHEEFMSNWPSFRGPQGCGLTGIATAPTAWDGPSGRGIAWKSPIPLPGKNSPIAWGNKIFLSGGTETAQEVYCYNADTGAVLWREAVTGPIPGSEITVNDDTGYAPNTLATDGLRVYAMFPTGDLAAFDFAGQPLWTKNLGKVESTYGFAASLAVYRDRVIVQCDQGNTASAGKSAILCFDGATGNQLWRTRRSVSCSWSSPIVVYPQAGKPQIITVANPLVVAYDADTGKELWNAQLMDGDIAASPAFAGEKVFVANDQSNATAIGIDGTGDVTKTHVLWSAEDGVPEMVSPLATDDVVVLFRSATATCYDAKSGKKCWENEMGDAFNASPVAIGKTVYAIDTQGVMHMFEAGAEYKEIATAALGEEVHASPAFVRSGDSTHIIIRGKANLYCIKGEAAH